MKNVFKYVIGMLIMLIMLNLEFTDGFAAESSIVEFNFDASGKVSGEKLKEYGDKNGYVPTSGNGTLQCFISGDNSRALEWSGAEYNGSSVVPIIRASKKNPWGNYPFFNVSFSTKGLNQVKISAQMAGSSNGPATWKLQYSKDKVTYIDVPSSEVTISQDSRKTMTNYYNSFMLPGDTADCDNISVRIIAVDSSTISGGSYESNVSGGETAINSIIVKASQIVNEPVTTTSQNITTQNVTNASNETTHIGEAQTTKQNNDNGNKSDSTEQKKNDIKGGNDSDNTINSANEKTQNDSNQINGEQSNSSTGSVDNTTDKNNNFISKKENGETLSKENGSDKSKDNKEENTSKDNSKKVKKGTKKVTTSSNVTTSGKISHNKKNMNINMTIVLIILVIILAGGISAVVIYSNKNRKSEK